MKPTTHITLPRPDSGWRDVTTLLPAGLSKSTANGRALALRTPTRVLLDLHLTVSQPNISTVFTLPPGWRPVGGVLIPFTYWTATTSNAALPTTVAAGYVGGGGASVRTLPLLSPGTVMIWLDLEAPLVDSIPVIGTTP